MHKNLHTNKNINIHKQNKKDRDIYTQTKHMKTHPAETSTNKKPQKHTDKEIHKYRRTRSHTNVLKYKH